MVHLSHPEPWVWMSSIRSFDRRTRRKTWPVVDAEIAGAAGGSCVFILWGLCVVSRAQEGRGHLWASSFLQHLGPNCHVKFLRFLWLSASGKYFTQRPDEFSVCWWRCTSSLLCRVWMSILKRAPSGEHEDPPAGLTLKWGIGRAAPGASPRWLSPGTCGCFPAVGLLSVHLSGRGWALVVLKFHSCMVAQDH